MRRRGAALQAGERSIQRWRRAGGVGSSCERGACQTEGRIRAAQGARRKGSALPASFERMAAPPCWSRHAASQGAVAATATVKRADVKKRCSDAQRNKKIRNERPRARICLLVQRVVVTCERVQLPVALRSRKKSRASRSCRRLAS